MRLRRLDKRAVRHSVKLLPRDGKVYRHNVRLRSKGHQLRLDGNPLPRSGNQLPLGARLLPRRNEKLRRRGARAHHLLEKMLPSRIANLRGDSKSELGITG
jgi:hypothetical protein